MNVFNLGQTVFSKGGHHNTSCPFVLFWCDYGIPSIRWLVLFFPSLESWWTFDYGGSAALWLLKLGHKMLWNFCWDTCPWNLAITMWLEHREPVGEQWWKREVLFLLDMSHKICSSILVFPGNCDFSSLSFFINKMDALNKMNFKLLVLMPYYFYDI